MTPNARTALIVCSDERADMLARVLTSRFRVYLRRFSADASAWTLSEFQQGEFKSVIEQRLPDLVDVLFFHTGRGDPGGIPSNIAIGREFAFSSPGLSAPPEIRSQAIPIQRPFSSICPLRSAHLPELEDFLAGRRNDLPRFCREDEIRAIAALCILCQGYQSARSGLERQSASSAEKVLSRSWWRKPFEPMGRSEIISAVGIESEDGIPQTAAVLVAWMFGDPLDTTLDDLVARALTDLNGILERT